MPVAFNEQIQDTQTETGQVSRASADKTLAPLLPGACHAPEVYGEGTLGAWRPGLLGLFPAFARILQEPKMPVSSLGVLSHLQDFSRPWHRRNF